MGIEKFDLSYYENATEDFHIQFVKDTELASHPHTHEYFQVYYISTGRLYHYVGDESACMSRGDMFIIPPDAVHYISAEEGASFYSFSFAPSFLCDYASVPHLVVNFLSGLLKNNENKIRAIVSLPHEEMLYIESLMSHIKVEFEARTIGYYDTVRMLSSLVITAIARRYYEAHGIKEHIKENREVIRHLLEYIENNYSSDLSVHGISRLFGMSESGFCKLFLTETGKTFNNYLNEKRIEKACEYISSGYKLTLICTHVGYNDFSTFYRNFKRCMGISPSEYKRKLLNK